MKKSLLIMLLMTLSTVASAHPGHGVVGFTNGIAHPLTGLDHILAMVSVGLWAASYAGKAKYLIPAVFVGTMTVGFVLGANGLELPFIETGIAFSVLALGLLSAWAKKQVPLAATLVITGIFALFHGVAHGAELQGDAIGFAVGFIISTAFLHAVGLVVGNRLHQLNVLNRIVGSAIGVVGAAMLFGAI